MHQFHQLAAVWVVMGVLSACGDQAVTAVSSQEFVEANRTEFRCSDPIAGGDTRLEFEFPENCSDCQVNDWFGAIDGDPGSAAHISMSLDHLSSTKLRVTAQDGVVFPAGGDAGAMFRFTGGQGSAAGLPSLWRIVIRTYLDGFMNANLHEAGSSFRTGPSTDSEGYRVYIYTQAVQPFDAVEIEFAAELGELRQSLQLFEVCSDF